MLATCRTHTTLPTDDPQRLRHFYEDTLGFTAFAERPNAVIYRTSSGSLFALSRASVPGRGGFTQMAFTVPDIEAEVAELRARGVVFEEYQTPRTEDGIARVGAGRAAWFKDPDGNLLGILEWDEPL
jgi:catechol 2,3-dioxygenase-like lactoylglutathione lyase family enzyme